MTTKSKALKKKTSRFDRFVDKHFGKNPAVHKDSAAHEKRAAHAFRLLKKSN